MCFVVFGKNCIEHDDGDADVGAHADQTPIDIRGDDALRERRDQAGLRRGQRRRSQFRARRADETVGLIDQIEHRRNDDRAGENTDDERDLLFPRRRIDQLAGLQILQVVVRDRGDVENHRGGEKREGHQRLGRFRPDVRFHAEHEQQRRADHDQDADAGERAVG